MAKASKKNTQDTQIVEETQGMKFSEYLEQVQSNYDEAKAELDTRVTHPTQGFDEYDTLYRSHIPSKKWPFNSKIFISSSFSTLFAKGTRIVTGKVKGRLIAGEFGNELGAQIGTEVLSSQYDDHDSYFEESLVSRWFRMDQNARKYGASFGLNAWRREYDSDGKLMYDGPVFEVLDNRKVYLQPGLPAITDKDYVIVEREKSIDELQRINDAATGNGGEPIYQNLDLLESLNQTESTSKTTENPSINTRLRNLNQTSHGKGKFKRFRILTEYRRDVWITWCPDVGGKDNEPTGVVLRVTENPYKTKHIPVIRLVYMPIDDDSYGISELEPGRTNQKAMNALTSGFIEAVSVELYPIIKGHPTNVDWKTIQFKPRAAWIMNNPASDVMRLEGGVTFTRNFVEAFKLLDSKLAQSMGDTTADSSQLAALSADKTATEIKDSALQRTSRDNLNKLFLASAMTKMYTMWWNMDQQFLTDKKVIRIAGRQALEYFVKQGLAGWKLSDEGYQLINEFLEQRPQIIDSATGAIVDNTFELAYEALRQAGELDNYAEPLFPVMEQGKKLPKLQMTEGDKTGFLTAEPKDLTGKYHFTVDLNTVGQTTDAQDAANMFNLIDRTERLVPVIAQEGYKVKFKEMLESAAEKSQVKNPDQYFEQVDQGANQNNGQLSQQGQPSQGGSAQNHMAQKGPSESINFKDLPPEGQIQMAQQAGINLSEGQSQVQPSQPGQMGVGNQPGQLTPQNILGTMGVQNG